MSELNQYWLELMAQRKADRAVRYLRRIAHQVTQATFVLYLRDFLKRPWASKKYLTIATKYALHVFSTTTQCREDRIETGSVEWLKYGLVSNDGFDVWMEYFWKKIEDDTRDEAKRSEKRATFAKIAHLQFNIQGKKYHPSAESRLTKFMNKVAPPELDLLNKLMWLDAPGGVFDLFMKGKTYKVQDNLILAAFRYEMSEDNIRFLMSRTPDSGKGKTFGNAAPFAIAAANGYSASLVYELMQWDMSQTAECLIAIRNAPVPVVVNRGSRSRDDRNDASRNTRSRNT